MAANAVPASPHPSGLIVDPRPIRPLRALRSTLRLLREPEETALVFEIIRDLSGRSFEKVFAKTMADPQGAAILNDRRQLLARLSDRDALRALPEGTLGREYARFMDAERITADGLEEASQVEDLDRVFYDDRAQCLSDRLRDMHDLWHVVTGYGRDLLGENALLAFTYAQLKNRGIGLITLMGALKFKSIGVAHAWPLIRDGYRRGKHAAFFAAADWEDLLSRPLSEVRTILAVGEPEAYEPVFQPEEERAPETPV